MLNHRFSDATIYKSLAGIYDKVHRYRCIQPVEAEIVSTMPHYRLVRPPLQQESSFEQRKLELGNHSLPNSAENWGDDFACLSII